MQVDSKNSAQIYNIRDNIVPVLPILECTLVHEQFHQQSVRLLKH